MAVEPEGLFDTIVRLWNTFGTHFSIVAIFWKAIDMYGNYLEKGREAQLSKIVENQTKEIKESLHELKEAVMELKIRSR